MRSVTNWVARVFRPTAGSHDTCTSRILERVGRVATSWPMRILPMLSFPGKKNPLSPENILTASVTHLHIYIYKNIKIGNARLAELPVRKRTSGHNHQVR